MYCANCGSKLPDDAVFCGECGAAIVTTEPAREPSPVVEPVSEGKRKGSKVTENIILGTDGKYHWFYEFRLMKNPTILKVLWKIFFWVFVGMWAFLSIINFIDGHFNMKDFLDFSKIFLLILVGFEVFVAVGYFIYAAIQGFRYCVMFDMDENGVTHTQMPGQFKKSQAVSFLTILMGMAAGSPGTVGTGMLAGSKQSIASHWTSVRSIEIDAKHNVIKVNEHLYKNQVYAEDADFEFVENFIRTHVTKKCKVK